MGSVLGSEKRAKKAPPVSDSQCFAKPTKPPPIPPRTSKYHKSQGVHSQNTPEVHISNGSSSGLAPISAANGDCPTDTSVTPSHKTESTSIKYADLDLESQEGSVHGIKSSVKYSKVKSS